MGAGGSESGLRADAAVAVADSERAPGVRTAHWTESVKRGGSDGSRAGVGLVLVRQQVQAMLQFWAGVSEAAVEGLVKVHAGAGAGSIEAEAAELQATMHARRQVWRSTQAASFYFCFR